jgi:hypothetical protein
MRHWRAFGKFVILLASGLLAGCSQGDGNGSSEPELPDWLTQEADTGSPATTRSEQQLEQIEKARLRLNLNPGDRFPLRKVVEQELTQTSANGEPHVNRSRLEVMFAITVTDRSEDRTQLQVRYDRVQYSHDIADERIEYDSTRQGRFADAALPAPGAEDGAGRADASTTDEIPLAALAYHNMVGDGFSFWLGANNQIEEVEGFAEFMKRCLSEIPENRRRDVLLGIEAGSGETGIANFVDNSIGLLPYDREPAPGDSWERPQRFGRPVPMHISNVYTLKELDDNFAVIDIRGRIAPTASLDRSTRTANGVEVTVNGGETLGSCTIYRETGLPKESRVDRTVEMTLTVTGGHQFRQRKRVTTTIEAFPAENSAPTVLGEAGSQEETSSSLSSHSGNHQPGPALR